MPANLTQQYLKAEQQYRQAATPDEELKWLQVMLAEIPKHKGTDKLQADIKHRISQTKKEIQAARRGSRRGHGVRIPRQGAGTAVLIGGPNAGKSRLLAALTHAKPEVAAYPFTTHTPAPGMMPWEDVAVQLIDTPPITPQYIEPHMDGIIRGADLAVLMADLGSDDGPQQCLDVLDRLGQTKTRLGTRPEVEDEDEIGLSYTPAILAPNKIDLPDARARLELLEEILEVDFPTHVISAEAGTGLAELRDAIYKALDVVRVYTKLPNAKEADMSHPFTLRRGGTLLDMAGQVHKDYLEGLKFARVWGSAVHDGTVVKGDYVLHDKDIVELHL